MDKADKFLISQAMDKLDQCQQKNMITSSNFLDLRQQSLLQQELFKYSAVNKCFFGGYDDAERAVLVFLPDYADLTMLDSVCCVRVQTSTSMPHSLTHRDYLGALMGLGIKREMVGDILVHEHGADLFVLEEVQDFILNNFTQAGHAHFHAESIPLDAIQQPKKEFELRRDTVPSLRLDCVISSAYSMSRGNACAYIEAGKVFVNGVQIFKKDYKINEGDKLVLRGKGKAILSSIGGLSKKDRIFIEIEKYK